MIARRELLAGLGAAALVLPFRQALARSVDGPIDFRIARKGDAIGRHSVSFNRDGEALEIAVSVEIDVRFGPLPIYRYRHNARERWLGGALAGIEATTNDNGDTFRVAMRRTDEGFRVEGPKGSYIAPLDTLPATHWNRRQLDGPMVNTQTGALMRPRIVSHGVDPVRLSDGTSIEARRYTVKDDETFDLWYAPDGRWVGLAFVGKDGADIRYLTSQA